MIPTLYEPFRHWSDGGKVWIYSDPHFDDPCCRKMDPSWPSSREQVRQLNRYIGKQDTFLCLGDVGDPSCADYIRARYKVLILGNHDRRGACREHFDEVYDGPLFVSEKLLLSHEPVYGIPWCVNVHGHDHGNKEAYGEGCRHVNLAANVCGFVPMDLGAEIKKGLLSGIPSLHRLAVQNGIGTPTTLREDMESSDEMIFGY